MGRTVRWLLLFLAAVSQADAAVWHVAAGAAPGGTGTSWSDPFPTIQNGIDAASADGGGEVWVKAGVYPEVATNGLASLQLRERVSVYGGFAGTESARTERDPIANRVYIEGTALSHGDATPTAPVVAGASICLLDGVTIRRGRAHRGAGLFCFRVAPTLRNCTLEDNIAIHDETIPRSGLGGAVSVVGGLRPIFEDCVFRRNRGILGGAIELENGKPTITRCRFEENYAYVVTGPVPGVPPDLWQDQSGSGGAIYGFEQAAALIEDSVFLNNTANTVGGAISFFERCEATVRRCRFIGNRADRDPAIVGLFPAGRGGAVEVQWDSSTFEQCFFRGNSSSNDGGAVFIAGLRAELHPEFEPAFLARSFADPLFINCIFLQNFSEGTGGAVMLFECLGRFVNCTFAGNKALRADGNTGGAIYALHFAAPALRNSILWHNTPYDIFDLPDTTYDPGDGSSIFVPGSATSAVFSNMGLVSSPPENLVNGILAGEGNISADPFFSGPCCDFLEPFDVTLAPGSPSQDTATGEGSPAADFNGRTRPEGAGFDMGALEGPPDNGDCGDGGVPVQGGQTHSADADASFTITLPELLRGIQFLNSDGLRCSAATEDGYAPGPGSTACAHHDSDYDPADWRISLGELLRLIQFYNMGGYHPCGSCEDGFCPGAN